MLIKFLYTAQTPALYYPSVFAWWVVLQAESALNPRLPQTRNRVSPQNLGQSATNPLQKPGF
ncbi:MAG: hypothetical protein ACRC8Y_06465 [Chroococcales cyanobacterium]